MAKLVLLSEGLTGRSHELVAEKTTIGRVEDNSIQIAEPSISSHHCEVWLRGKEVVIKDLDSTNGTFIEGNQISESVLMPGQILRLGQIQMRLETGEPHAPSKKPLDQTMVMARGVSLNELEQGPRGAGFDASNKGFSKRDNQANKIFLIVGIVLGLIIFGLLGYVFWSIGGGPGK
jgi:predicted component of type VI protein secretion system